MYDRVLNTPETEIAARIGALQQALRRQELDAALILQKADLYYYSATIQQAHLYVPAEGEPLLMVNKVLKRARAESPLSRIVALGSPRKIPETLDDHGLRMPKRLGLELDVLPTNLYFLLAGIFAGAELTDLSGAIRRMRSVKSPYEIELLREAARYSDRLAAAVPDLLREGMTEIDLAGRVEAEARRMGHQGIVRMRLWGSELLFYRHLLAGPSGGVPSYLASPTGGSGVSPAVAQGSGFRPIRRHEPILVDYVFAYRAYISDHARIFSIGALPEELTQAHAAMLALQHEIMTMAVPGTAAGAVYDFALAQAERSGYGRHFMGVGAERIRFVGHGVGLELDEFPFLNAGQRLELQTGMIIALEPKLIFPGKGAVGIENTHLVTPEGLERLGRFPDEVVVV